MQNYTQTQLLTAQHRIKDDREANDSMHWYDASIRKHLQQYLSVGLELVPLSGKKPLVRWKNWQGNNMGELEPYIRPRTNWGIKTGPRLTVIDFDSEYMFIEFMIKNKHKLPADTPIVRTQRGYHIWIKPTTHTRNQSFRGIDIKGKGGYVVVPPSIHPDGGQYRFITPLAGRIPRVDLEDLDFSLLTPRTRSNVQTASDYESPSDSWKLEPVFDWNAYKDGVHEGERHNTLVKYIGWLISRNFTLEEILTLARDWNRRNKPPLDAAELSYTVESCWQSWSKRNVSISTLSKNRVLIETKSKSFVSHQHDRYSDTAEKTTPDNWELESDSPHVTNPCGYKSRVVRRGKIYFSIPFFCGRWDCPRCSAYFRKRWLEHIVKKVDKKALYMMSCREEDWGRLHRKINRYKANYVRIVNGSNLIILTDQLLKGFSELPNENLRGFLDETIPAKAPSCPVSTSRDWTRQKDTKSDTGYRLVMDTYLPDDQLVEIAEVLGGEAGYGGNEMVILNNEVHRYRCRSWSSPADIDEEFWEKQFLEAVRSREEPSYEVPIACNHMGISVPVQHFTAVAF